MGEKHNSDNNTGIWIIEKASRRHRSPELQNTLRCSECGYRNFTYLPLQSCPGCDAKMKGIRHEGEERKE